MISRVTGTTDYSGFRRADLVIEAVFEDIAVKRNVIKELEDIVREDTVIATNTSALPIADIAKNAMHPERIVGMHFFSPVHRMPLVEVVRPEKADPKALAMVVAEAQAMGKTAIVVRDTPGFYTTRVLGFMLAEAMSLLEEGARIEDIDRAMVAFGWPIGPLALTDEVGLTVARHVGETVAAARGIKNGPSAVQRLTDAGMTGKRGGRGFYRYNGKKQHAEPGRLRAHRHGARRGVARRGDRAAPHAPVRQRGRALPRRGRAALGRRGRPRRRHGPRLPAVPRRPVPLGRYRGRRDAR